MGCFDTIKTNFKMPDGKSSESYQTKDFGCDLHYYYLDRESGLLLFNFPYYLNPINKNHSYIISTNKAFRINEWWDNRDNYPEEIDIISDDLEEYRLYFENNKLHSIKLLTTGQEFVEEYDENGDDLYDWDYDNRYELLYDDSYEYRLMERRKNEW